MPYDDQTTKPSSRPLGSASPYASPILAAIDPQELPAPLPACADCPASVWYRDQGLIKAYCSVLKGVMSGNEDQSFVSACDGREQAIAQMLAEQAKAAG